MDPTGLKPLPPVGDRVRLEGVSGQGGFAPIVKRLRITVLGPGELPAPRSLPWDHLLTGIEDNQWVEVVDPGGRAWCPRRDQPGQANTLVDARVRIRGRGMKVDESKPNAVVESHYFLLLGENGYPGLVGWLLVIATGLWRNLRAWLALGGRQRAARCRAERGA